MKRISSTKERVEIGILGKILSPFFKYMKDRGNVKSK